MIGSDVSEYVPNYANGIGASFVSRGIRPEMVTENLRLLSEAFDNKSLIPIRHFGTINYFNGTASEINKKKAELFGKYRVISWNLPNANTLNNLKASELRYPVEEELVDPISLRDFYNNYDLQQSILLLNLIKKGQIEKPKQNL